MDSLFAGPRTKREGLHRASQQKARKPSCRLSPAVDESFGCCSLHYSFLQPTSSSYLSRLSVPCIRSPGLLFGHLRTSAQSLARIIPAGTTSPWESGHSDTTLRASAQLVPLPMLTSQMRHFLRILLKKTLLLHHCNRCKLSPRLVAPSSGGHVLGGPA